MLIGGGEGTLNSEGYIVGPNRGDDNEVGARKKGEWKEGSFAPAAVWWSGCAGVDS